MGALLARRLSSLVRAILPFGLTLFLMILGLLPWHFPFAGAAHPSFILVSVYFWVLHQPSLMPVWAVFLLGLLHDMLGLAPLGSGTLSLLMAYGVTASLRQFLVHAPIPMVLGGLGVTAFLSRLIGWMIASISISALQDIRPAIFLFAVDLVSYLPIAYLFARIQQSALGSRPS